MRRFQFLENIATADCAFLAYGKTLSEVFENSALALFETMVETKKVNPAKSYRLQAKSSNLEDLLYDFLSELVFLKDQKSMLFSKFKVRIEPQSQSLVKSESGRLPSLLNLQAEIWGEAVDPQRHRLKVDVKAVTRHLFEIKKERGKFVARVVLDI